ncbi:enolase C-terminal domain-like protein [Streptomyces sp. NPDC006283]|uniref:enolase C-terminal domain-like protein n=1 Tax=Streptomyces sp. NPDC006283 TaxID=3156741 RepID=UPI0033A7BD15
MVADGGFSAVKLKGTNDVQGDVAILRALREALPGADLRVDPNAAWSVPDSVRAGIALEELDLEYLEDPCTGIEGMSQVRAKVRIPLCTNMCVVRFEEFAPAVRLGAVDLVHGDVYKWGGIAATKALAAHCETFGLGMNLHSGGELGIATAAHLAGVVASTPVLSRAIDSMYYLHADDIVEPLHLERGRLRVPEGPGLGVTVDEDKLRHYAELNRCKGDLTG